MYNIRWELKTKEGNIILIWLQCRCISAMRALRKRQYKFVNTIGNALQADMEIWVLTEPIYTHVTLNQSHKKVLILPLLISLHSRIIFVIYSICKKKTKYLKTMKCSLLEHMLNLSRFSLCKTYFYKSLEKSSLPHKEIKSVRNIT